MEVTKIVPQFFYDVIARGVPGGVLLIGASLSLGSDVGVTDIVLTGIDTKAEPITSTILLVTLFAFYSYVLGHIFEPLGDIITNWDKFKNRFEKYLKVLETCVDPDKSELPRNIQQFLATEINLSQENLTTNFKHSTILFIWSDWLRLKSADVGSRIVKLRAEYRMLIGLSVVGLSTTTIHLVAAASMTNVTFNWLIIAGGLFVFTMGLIGYCRAYKTFQWSVINNYFATKTLDNKKTRSDKVKKVAVSADELIRNLKEIS